MAWMFLLGAGACEVACTTLFRHVEGFTRLAPTIAFVAFGCLSVFLLYKSLDGIPLGTAYAAWTGIGAAGTVIIGILAYNEPTTALRLAMLSLLIGSIMGLKLVSDS